MQAYSDRLSRFAIVRQLHLTHSAAGSRIFGRGHHGPRHDRIRDAHTEQEYRCKAADTPIISGLIMPKYHPVVEAIDQIGSARSKQASSHSIAPAGARPAGSCQSCFPRRRLISILQEVRTFRKSAWSRQGSRGAQNAPTIDVIAPAEDLLTQWFGDQYRGVRAARLNCLGISAFKRYGKALPAGRL